jgi:tetratricopeptide (TPR) repeat protein
MKEKDDAFHGTRPAVAGRGLTDAIAALVKNTGSIEQATEAIAGIYRAFGPNTRIIGSYTNQEGAARYIIKREQDQGITVVSPARADPQGAKPMDRGISYAEQGRWDNAYEVFTGILRKDPGCVAAYINRANVCFSKGDFKQALADYNEALRLDPANVLAYAGRAGLYRIQGDLEPALADSNEAIRLDPGYGAAYYTRGTVYHLLKDYENTRADWEHALRLNAELAFIKESLEALRQEAAQDALSRGEVLAAQGEWEFALEDYNEALRLNSGDAGAYVKRGEAHAALSEWKDALADYREAVRIDPACVTAYICRGRLHYERGEPELARANWKQALKLDPGCDAVREALDDLDEED